MYIELSHTIIESCMFFSREISVRNFWQFCYSNQAEAVVIKKREFQNDDPTSITIRYGMFLRT